MKRAAAASRWLLLPLLGLVLVHAGGAFFDFVAAIRDPYQLDYGEGIVWYQASLIPGPEMYARGGSGLPFIVFHYPPLYHLLSRLTALAVPDLLSAGRLVSVVATLFAVGGIAGLVLACVRGPRRGWDVTIAAASGLLALSLHAVHVWGPLMRVDMLAVALGLLGVLVAARSDGGFRSIAVALLLCTAAVFAKQTQLPAGCAVFLVALIRRPSAALGGAALAGVVALAALGGLQWATGGGFVQNIFAANINRFDWAYAHAVFDPEQSSWRLMAVMVAGAGAVLWGLVAGAGSGPGRTVRAVRQGERAVAARAMVLLHFACASVMLVTALKSGGNFNYLIDWLCVGCTLLGVVLSDLVVTPLRFGAVAGVLALGVSVQPLRYYPDHRSAAELAAQDALTRRIAAADRPVASADMVLLMRAGRPVLFEPAIVTELASVGSWDETPLVRGMREGAFAFVITSDNLGGPMAHRTPAVDAAMRASYPRVEQAAPRLWLHLPPG